VAPLVAANSSGGLCFGIMAEGFSRRPAHTECDRKHVGEIQRMQHDPADVRVAVARQRPAPRLDRIDRLDPAGETEILDRLHDDTRVFIKPVRIFVQADNVGRILRELNIAGRRNPMASSASAAICCA